MIFLIRYHRQAGRIVLMQRFDASNRQAAEDSRLAVELTLRQQRIDDEVVLLEAADESALRKTHQRYFELPSTIATPSSHDL